MALSSRNVIGLPRLRAMSCIPRAMLGVVMATSAPVVLRAQLVSSFGSIGVSASVMARPLTLSAIAASAVSRQLLVSVDGCAQGTLAVDARLGNGATRRTSYTTIAATNNCGARTLIVQLSEQHPAAVEFMITLEQPSALGSSAFSQVLIPADHWPVRTALTSR
jgi:hypothetical protein